MSVSKDDILALSVPERIQLVEEIWDSIATEPETVPYPEPNARNSIVASVSTVLMHPGQSPGQRFGRGLNGGESERAIYTG